MKKRNYLVDNSKIICIFFTVFGHCLELFAPYNKMLLLIIYSFHMPVFIFFSGYYAKYNFRKIVRDFLIPYIAMEIITFIVCSFVEPTEFHIIHGYTSLWYLISLSFWYCATKL